MKWKAYSVFVAKRTKWRLRTWMLATLVVMVGTAVTIAGLWLGYSVPRLSVTAYLAVLLVTCWDNFDSLRAERSRQKVVERVQQGAIEYVERNS
jgi:hypothetical protein